MLYFLAIIWAAGFFAHNSGTLIHMLLVIAVFALLSIYNLRAMFFLINKITTK